MRFPGQPKLKLPLTLLEAVADLVLLVHPRTNVPTHIVVDASGISIGAVPQQKTDYEWHLLGLFSRKLEPAKTCYSVFGCELLAIYSNIQHFRHFLEGESFHVLRDHNFARVLRQLAYISEFTTDIGHIKGTDNEAADGLSRITSVGTSVDWEHLAQAQMEDPELHCVTTPVPPIYNLCLIRWYLAHCGVT